MKIIVRLTLLASLQNKRTEAALKLNDCYIGTMEGVGTASRIPASFDVLRLPYVVPDIKRDPIKPHAQRANKSTGSICDDFKWEFDGVCVRLFECDLTLRLPENLVLTLSLIIPPAFISAHSLISTIFLSP